MKRKKRKTITPFARLRAGLAKDYRFWAAVPQKVSRLLFQVDDADAKDGTGTILGGSDVLRPKFPRGVCRSCGCSHFDPCMTKVGPCAWANRERTLCSACEGK